ncbi:MAG TPA: histidine--tRNA ligase [Ruminococcaceae bacterium]|nr:histidine--tRNA ligase [Oscillospiraceae bacterium]
MEPIKAQRGTQDILPGQSGHWQAVEAALRSEAETAGFREIRTPLFEDTRLFQRSVGEATDVVEKEMYTFKDRGGRSITLKPEGTAGAVRAYLEHGLYNSPMPVRLYYFTPCYRYERAQAGRLREFHQFGVEEFGSALPLADAGLIALAAGTFGRLGVRGLTLKINSIGCPDCRAEYVRALRAYFTAHIGRLCETCRSRLERSPMRILDCKNPSCAAVAAKAPRILDYLCDECRAHFAQVRAGLDAAGVRYEVDPSIVRGLDYYTRTVFEFVSGDLGAQSTVCGGGRYDGLVQEMGGKATPALGFAMGIERLLLIMDAQQAEFPPRKTCDLYIAPLGERARSEAFRLVCALRKSSVAAACDEVGRSLNAQMKYAGKIGAKFTLVLGDDELKTGRAALKNMKTGDTAEISLKEGFVRQFAAVSAAAETAGF